jgi:hypothetical protein
MEVEKRAYNYEYGVRGKCANLGIEGKNSIVHGEVDEESMNLLEIIKGLQKDFQNYKFDNERFMKSTE